MANGQQIGEENYQAFLAWMTDKSDDDFKEYVYRTSLKRTEIASECGFDKSALRQNPRIKASLKALEDGLRERGILPTEQSATNKNNNDAPKRDKNAKQNSINQQRLNALEQQNAALLAKVKDLEAKLNELNAFEEYLLETGRIPQ